MLLPLPGNMLLHNNHLAFLLIAPLLSLASCKNRGEQWNTLPEVTPITKLPKTAFVPTLESPLPENKNVVYAAAFLYAWDKVNETVNTTVSVSSGNSAGFHILNHSTSYKNTLEPDEYTAEALIVDSLIIAKAFFNKTLPYPAKLQKSTSPIVFDKVRVAAFGMNYYDVSIAGVAEILNYKDDDHFVLRLSPKDKNHEIQIIKGLKGAGNFSEAVVGVNNLINTGKKERTIDSLAWKYQWNEEDIFSIPSIAFNIENNFSEIEGQVFEVNNKRLVVQTAYQRTAFLLNENGAVVESEANVVVDSLTAEPVIIQPKKMTCDQPFFILIRRTNSPNPYFMMYVQNSELLTKDNLTRQ